MLICAHNIIQLGGQPEERDINMDLDFLAGITTSKPPVNPSAASDIGGFNQSTKGYDLGAPLSPPLEFKRGSRSISPSHAKLSPAAGAFLRSLPDLSYMLGPPGLTEARE